MQRIEHRGHAAFSQGTFGNGGANLFVDAGGVVRRIMDNDLNGDGFFDIQQVRHTTNFNEVLAAPSLDGVILTVPDRFHKDVAIQCLNAKKHLMLEKPMALTAGDCLAIIDASEKAGCILQIGFVLRATPFYRKIKELIDAGTFGQIMSISACEYLGFSQ